MRTDNIFLGTFQVGFRVREVGGRSWKFFLGVYQLGFRLREVGGRCEKDCLGIYQLGLRLREVRGRCKKFYLGIYQLGLRLREVGGRCANFFLAYTSLGSDCERSKEEPERPCRNVQTIGKKFGEPRIFLDFGQFCKGSSCERYVNIMCIL